jgi:transcriptional regulator with XRE-family HTH domain
MRQLFELLGENKSEVARRLGLVQSGVNRILAGTQGTSRATCERLADLLGVDVEEVLGHVEPSGHAAAPDIYEDRGKAIARIRDILPREVVEEVRELFVDPANPPTERDWVKIIVRRLAVWESTRAAEEKIRQPPPPPPPVEDKPKRP